MVRALEIEPSILAAFRMFALGVPSLVRVYTTFSWLAAPLLLRCGTRPHGCGRSHGACLTLSFSNGIQNYPTAPRPPLNNNRKGGPHVLQQTPQKSMNLAGCFARKKMSSICYTLTQSGIHDPNRFRVLESEQDFLEVYDLSVTDFDIFFS